jgi:exodeoxyribonuclease VII large subunit
MGQSLSRLMRYKIVNARTRVQEQALSQVFDEVRGKLRDAGASTSAARHRLQILVGEALRNAHLRADPLSRSLAPVQLRARFAEARVRFDSAYSDCNTAFGKQMEEAEKRLGLAAASLDALSPLSVLRRGYAIAQRADGTLLRDAKSVSIGDSVRVRLAKGTLGARVEGIEDDV